MSSPDNTLREKGARFKALHHDEDAFIMPNAWEAVYPVTA